jgi:hypothetical protein
VRHSTRHVDRELYAIEFHRCDRCRHIFFSHGHYILHDCKNPEWIHAAAIYPEPVVYPGDVSVHHDQQVESVRSRWTDLDGSSLRYQGPVIGAASGRRRRNFGWSPGPRGPRVR